MASDTGMPVYGMRPTLTLTSTAFVVKVDACFPITRSFSGGPVLAMLVSPTKYSK